MLLLQPVIHLLLMPNQSNFGNLSDDTLEAALEPSETQVSDVPKTVKLY
jgi:hypothetical protein